MNISGVRSKLAKLLNSALCILHSAFVELRSTLVGLDGLEPSTSRLSGARSNHLSYKPLLCVDSSHLPTRVCAFRLVEMMGFEPMTPCLQGRCSPS